MVTLPPVVIQADWHLELAEFELTAYTNNYEDCGKIDGITASGTNVRQGVIAAPPHIKFGTKILINGSQFIVEDRGSAIVRKADGTNVIDVWMPNKEECVRFGRFRTKGWIVVKNDAIVDAS